jgi:hypothetical protein
MARAVTVKVATAKVIKALEDKIANNTKVIASNEKKRDAYKVAQDKYFKTILKEFKDSLVIDSISKHSWRNSLSVSYEIVGGTKLPDEPEIERLEQELGNYEIQEIENGIRILKMTDEEFVSTSTFKSIAQYL